MTKTKRTLLLTVPLLIALSLWLLAMGRFLESLLLWIVIGPVYLSFLRRLGRQPDESIGRESELSRNPEDALKLSVSYIAAHAAVDPDHGRNQHSNGVPRADALGREAGSGETLPFKPLVSVIGGEHEAAFQFRDALKSETPYAFVTALMAVACIAVYVVMVVMGVSPNNPSGEALLDWGANFGPYVAVDREYWRLFTSLFLHGGLIHLAFNMWCLVSAGPMIERFFGNLGFAAIYLISGLGGALASLAVHPGTVCVGASGAIFGIFGALGGFLVARHQSVPAALLRPLRSSTTGFIFYNIVLGMMDHRVDMAAHLGGLATGFACGLFLHRRLPHVEGERGLARRLAGAFAMVLLLFLAGRFLTGRLIADPGMLSLSHERQKAERSYNQLAANLAKPLEGFNRVRRDLTRLLQRVERTNSFEPGDAALIDGLIRSAQGDLDTLRRISIPFEEIRGILDSAIRAQHELRQALEVTRHLVNQPDRKQVEGPDGLISHLTASDRAVKEFAAKQKAYFAAHGLSAMTNP